MNKVISYFFKLYIYISNFIKKIKIKIELNIKVRQIFILFNLYFVLDIGKIISYTI